MKPILAIVPEAAESRSAPTSPMTGSSGAPPRAEEYPRVERSPTTNPRVATPMMQPPHPYPRDRGLAGRPVSATLLADLRHATVTPPATTKLAPARENHGFATAAVLSLWSPRIQPNSTAQTQVLVIRNTGQPGEAVNGFRRSR